MSVYVSSLWHFLSDIFVNIELFTYSDSLKMYVFFLYVVNILGLFSKTKRFYLQSQMEKLNLNISKLLKMQKERYYWVL